MWYVKRDDGALAGEFARQPNEQQLTRIARKLAPNAALDCHMNAAGTQLRVFELREEESLQRYDLLFTLQVEFVRHMRLDASACYAHQLLAMDKLSDKLRLKELQVMSVADVRLLDARQALYNCDDCVEKAVRLLMADAFDLSSVEELAQQHKVPRLFVLAAIRLNTGDLEQTLRDYKAR